MDYNTLDINRLSGDEFESLCGELLISIGFEILTTKQSRDGGVDIFAYNNNPLTSGKYVVQCKRYSGSVGEPIIRDLFGVMTSERANKGILITTGVFTSSAKIFAKDKPLELIDGNQLHDLIEQHLGDNPGVSTFDLDALFIDDHYDDELIERYYFLKEFVHNNPNSLNEIISLIEIIEEEFINSANLFYDDNNPKTGRHLFRRCVLESEKYWKRIERVASSDKQIAFIKQYALLQRAYNHLRVGSLNDSLKNYCEFLRWDCLSKTNVGNKGVEYLGIVAINNVFQICKILDASEIAIAFVQQHSHIINEFIKSVEWSLSRSNMEPQLVPAFTAYLSHMGDLLNGNSDAFMGYTLWPGTLMRISQWNDEHKYYPEKNALILTVPMDELQTGEFALFEVSDQERKSATMYIKHIILSGLVNEN